MSDNSTIYPTGSVCRPLYYENFFIFDREDLLTLSSAPSNDLTSVRNREGRSINLHASELRTITDITFWSFSVLIVCLFLLGLTCCCHCCLCYITKRSSVRGKNAKKPFFTVFGCGILTAAVILFCFVDGVILLWMEVDLNQNLTRQADYVQYYVNITTDLTRGDNYTVKQITLDPLFRLQDIRFWITLAVQGSMLVILAIMVLSVCICTPISKSSAPIVTMLIVEAICTFFASIVASVLFGTLLFFSIVCYDLYRLGGGRWCDQVRNEPLMTTLGQFCGRESFDRFYIMAGMYGVLILLMVLTQLFGGVYTAVVSRGYKERSQRQQTSHQDTQEHQQQQQHRTDQRRPSRNMARSTTASTIVEETFVLRSRDSSHYHHLRPRQNSSSIGFRDQGTNLDGNSSNVSSHMDNVSNLSTITYPKEAPPSYDEVVRRGSESSISAPLIANPVSSPQGLSCVQENDEPLNDSNQVDQVDTQTSIHEDSATVEQNIHLNDEHSLA